MKELMLKQRFVSAAALAGDSDSDMVGSSSL